MNRSLTLLLFLSLSFFAQAQEDDHAYDVFLIAGQSNTLHGCCKDPALQEEDPDIKQLGRFEDEDMQIIPAIEPLAHHSTKEDWIGFATTFAALYKEKFLEDGRKILLIPCGKGGTGFSNKQWNPTQELYVDAVERTNHVLETYPNARLKAILWQQGERDARDNNDDYQKNLDKFITSIRSDIHDADSIPFIMGGMVPYWVDDKRRRDDFEKIIRRTPRRMPRVWYVDPRDPFPIEKRHKDEDPIHYDANGQIELGNRYFKIYKQMLADLKARGASE
jgi:hypothetical protein